MDIDRAVVGLLALGAVVVLAGCGGVLGGPETAAATETPTATPEPTPTPAPLETFEYPNGTSRDDLNYTVLSAEHAAVLADQGYEYSEVEVGYGAFDHRQVNNLTSDPATERRFEHLVRNNQGTNGTWSNVTYDAYWRNGTRYHRTNRSGSVTNYTRNVTVPFDRAHDPASGRSVGNGHLRLVMSMFEWEAQEVTTVLDRQVVRYETTAVNQNATNATFGTDSRATLAVAESGAVLELDLTLVTRPGTDRERTIEMRYRVEQLGDVTLEEPAWVPSQNGTATPTAS